MIVGKCTHCHNIYNICDITCHGSASSYLLTCVCVRLYIHIYLSTPKNNDNWCPYPVVMKPINASITIMPRWPTDGAQPCWQWRTHKHAQSTRVAQHIHTLTIAVSGPVEYMGRPPDPIQMYSIIGFWVRSVYYVYFNAMSNQILRCFVAYMTRKHTRNPHANMPRPRPRSTSTTTAATATCHVFAYARAVRVHCHCCRRITTIVRRKPCSPNQQLNYT